ncbi:unannotated protein [freshwater metagenome]|uniref:Unannotated protein n=1 Tax=freshwater metagenome TaxID=449393 RepID=A0A6J6EMA9_9ZZZZ|nr:Rieske 2Fe-2S domain-containing protein [Actinomycetota bacterium]
MVVALDPHLYRDPDWYRRERFSVWSDQWLMFCAESEIATDGSYVAAEIADFPVVVARRPGGELVGFLNVCPHRAGPILWPGQGVTGNLVCRYHGWAFNWNGDLVSARDFGESDDLCPEQRALTTIDVDVWCGMVFVRVRRGDSELLDDLGGLPEVVGRFPVDRFRFVRRMVRTLECNWKTYVDNYLEGYHVQLIHPSLTRALDMRTYRVSVPEDGYCHHTCDTTEGSPSGGAWLFRYPNLALNIYADGMNVERIIPVGPNRTHVVYDYYSESASESDIEAMLTMSNVVLDEDQAMCEQVQRAIDSGAYRGGPLSPKHEIAVAWFQDRLRAETASTL